jgi:hypothetical protein
MPPHLPGKAGEQDQHIREIRNFKALDIDGSHNQCSNRE